VSGFLLDTNVSSEMLRSRPDTNVAAWLRSQGKAGLFLSVVTMGELRKASGDSSSRRKAHSD